MPGHTFKKASTSPPVQIQLQQPLERLSRTDLVGRNAHRLKPSVQRYTEENRAPLLLRTSKRCIAAVFESGIVVVERHSKVAVVTPVFTPAIGEDD